MITTVAELRKFIAGKRPDALVEITDNRMVYVVGERVSLARKIKIADMFTLLDLGHDPSEVARRLSVSRQYVHQCMEKYEYKKAKP